MGDAYRKLVDGGNAVQSYQKALTLDPKLAEAKYKIGKIYETQNNPEFYLPAYTDAIALDPNYAPAFYALYTHYFNHGDVDKATDYLNKFIAVADPSPQNEYDRTALLFLQKKYDEAIAGSKDAIAKQGDKADAHYYLLAAYSYDAKGDSVNAKDYLTQYFAKQKPDQVIAMDYKFMGKIQSEFPSDSAASIISYQKAIEMDTVLANKLQILKDAANDAKAKGHKAAYAYWLTVGYPFIKTPTNTDLYNVGMANYQAGLYKEADSIFCQVYETKYPDEIYGYLWCSRSKVAEDDSVGSNGYAVPAYEKLAEVGRRLDSTARAANSPDSVKYRVQVVNAYSQLAGYYNNIKKDRENAMLYLHKILEVEPNNADAKRFIDILEKAAQRQKARAEAAQKRESRTK
jgi:tetratricopeptide (TPR) repeat protein